MPATARIQQADLEAHFPPTTVQAVFADAGTKTPGPRLARSCLRASRVAESYLLRAWSPEQIDKLFLEDEGIVGATCGLAMAFGTEGRTAWSGAGAPFEGLYKRSLNELKEIADGARRSLGESKGAGVNPTIKGSITPTQDPPFMFASTRDKPRRGGY